MDITVLLYFAISLLIALTFHEFAHAYIATLLGDSTAKSLGRVTLNPLAHLDPLGTVMIVLTLLSGFGLGWGKPVPVNPYQLKPNPKAGMALVAAAGPASNLVLAVVFSWIIQQDVSRAVQTFLYANMVINVSLAVFNLIPIPPLDGFRILLGILPTRIAYTVAPVEQYGPIILLLLVFSGTGIIGSILRTFRDPILSALLG